MAGGRSYQALLLPPLDTVRLRTMEVIAGFAAAGGAVFAHAQLPRYAAEGPESDGRVADMVREMTASGALGGSEPGSPPVIYLLRSRVPPRCELDLPARGAGAPVTLRPSKR